MLEYFGYKGVNTPDAIASAIGASQPQLTPKMQDMILTRRIRILTKLASVDKASLTVLYTVARAIYCDMIGILKGLMEEGYVEEATKTNRGSYTYRITQKGCDYVNEYIEEGR